MVQFPREEDGQIHIEYNDGSIESGNPIDLYARLREAKGLHEWIRGIMNKAKRDVEESRRRQQLPPVAPLPPLPPQEPVSPTVPVEQKPVGGDSPTQQGAKVVPTAAELKLQSSEPLLSSREPSHSAWEQTAPLDAADVADRVSRRSTAPVDYDSLLDRILKNKPEPGEPHPSHAAPAARSPAADA